MNIQLNENYIDRFDMESNEYILYNFETGEMKLLNKMGAFIWSVLVKDKSFEGLLNECYNKFSNVDKSKIKNDVEKFLNNLKEQGVIEYD